MNVSRAGFLKICGAVLLGRTADASPLFAAFGGAFGFPAPATPRAPFRVEHAGAALFRPHLHSTFTVRWNDGARLPLVLAQITEGPADANIEQFSLSFHASPGAPLPHDTYALQHPVLGDFDLFIAPIGAASAERTVYEACFSRHVSDQQSARVGSGTAAAGGDTACQAPS